MRKSLFALLVLSLIGGAAAAQVWMEPFNYPNGTTIGSWKEFLGDWNAVNNTAESEQKRAYQYLTQPNRVYQDCALECMVFYNPKSSQKLQFGGVTVRCNNPAGSTDLVHVKVQDNNSSGDFDSIWLYDRPGGATAKTSITGFLKAKVRLLCIDKRLEAQIDDTGDGLWDHILARTTALTVKAGPIGLCAYGGAQMDDFAVFDAVILGDTTNPKPQPNTVQKFVLRGKPGLGYQAATSFGNRGIVLPDGRVIPLTAEPLFFLSTSGLAPTIFTNYNNFLDINGDNTVQLAIPNIPALIGNTVYTGFVTFDASGIIQISNDHQVTIVS